VKTLLTAAWVATMDNVTLRDGGVVHEGEKILAVGAGKALKQAHPDATIEELGSVVLLPGLINAHCHLDLTFAKRPPGPITFADWVLKLLEQVQRDEGFHEKTGDIGTGMAQSISCGVTCIGDVTATPVGVRGVIGLQQRRPRVVSYGEVRAMGSRRGLLDERLMAATEPTMSPLTRIGVSPHAPYSIEPQGIRECLAVARRRKLPLTMHLAETRDEAEFLADHRGPLRDLWEAIGGWDEAVPRFEGGPIRYAKELGLLDYEQASFAHVNYCDDDELALLARGRASVVYCPRTHRYFGHPPHRWRDMLAAGINVAVGTDSCASSPDLNLVDDLRLLHEIAPDLPAETIWSMATSRGAKAVGMESQVGTITPGKAADIAAFVTDGNDPLMAILQDASRRPSRVWVGGERIV
jgi:aminodeoxyfutalosine deaminase